jgi:thermitase
MRQGSSARYLGNLYRVRLKDPQADVRAVAQEYANHPDVEYAQPNYLMQTTAVPNDPMYPEQWAHQVTDIESAWDVQTGSSDVVIAIVDTGVDYLHEDLAPKIWHDDAGNPGRDFVHLEDTSTCWNGEDCVDVDDDPMDHQSHGTHCAGIAAAATNNGIGIAGVAQGARIMPIRAGYTYDNGTGIPVGAVDTAATIAGIEYATANGADVVSMSFGGFLQNQALLDALNNAHAEGVVLVASAGNYGAAARSYPAAYANVIAVAATAGDDTRASYSNFGWWVDVAAPGGDKSAGKDTGILSTVPTVGAPLFTDPSGYNSFNGTSMAAPYVAGLAALVLTEHPDASPEEVKVRIMGTAEPPSGLEAGMLGAGRVNAVDALTASPKPFLKVSALEVLELAGNNNGIPEEGEELGIRIELSNLWASTANAQVELVTANLNVDILQSTWTLGAMAAGEQRENSSQLLRLQWEGMQRDSTLVLGLRLTTDVGTRTIPVPIAVGTAAMTSGTDIEFDTAASDRYVAFVRLDDKYDEVNIYAIDLVTGEEIRVTDVPEYSMSGLVMPAGLELAHDHLVWTDNRAGSPDVYLYDFATGEESVVAGGQGVQRGAAVSEGRVVWSQQECPEGEDCHDDLYMTDLATGDVRLIAGGPGDQHSAKISGDRIVWTDERNGNEDIFLLDLSTNTEQALVVRPVGQTVYDFAGDILVYKDCLIGACNLVWEGDNADVIALNVVTGEEVNVSDTPVDQYYGRVWGNRVVWQEQRVEGNNDIFMLDLETGVETQLTRASASQYMPDIHGSMVFWTDQRYAASLYFTELGPRLGDVNYDSRVDGTDALLVAQHYSGFDVSPFFAEVADVDCDGQISILDALAIQRLNDGIIRRLPCSSE